MPRKIHRLLGLLLLLPITCWVVTGFLFHLKPGWRAAYDLPSVRSLPLSTNAAVTPRDGWLEMRLRRTVLGEHLLVRTADGWLHLDPATLEDRKPPSPEAIRELLDDCLAADERYGRVAEVDGLSAVTETGIRVDLNWQRLSLSQRGRDTDLIDWLYRVHYLQWTGVKAVDRTLGVVGLVSLALLALLGLRLAVRGRPGDGGPPG